jgi:hypothetical protein
MPPAFVRTQQGGKDIDRELFPYIIVRRRQNTIVAYTRPYPIRRETQPRASLDYNLDQSR